MKTLKTTGYAAIGSLTLALMTPAISVAEVNQVNTNSASGSHSLVHRVSHSLADADNYTGGSDSGYKWGKQAARTESADAQWADSTTRGGYKWGNSATTEKPASQSYAGSSSYKWGTMSFSDQAGYRWGQRSFSDQAGYRWGQRNFSDQTGYRWGQR